MLALKARRTTAPRRRRHEQAPAVLLRRSRRPHWQAKAQGERSGRACPYIHAWAHAEIREPGALRVREGDLRF